MSHVRNLLYNPVRQANPPAPSIVPKVPHSPVEETSLSNIPVVEAHVDHASRIVCYTDPRSAGADRYRLLRMRLRERYGTGKLKTLLITSAFPQDGKSTVTMNLATVLSERGKRPVLLVEADLHRPSLGHRLSLGPGTSLAECLQTGQNPMSAVRRIEPLGWYALFAGEARKNPTELLQTQTFGGIIQKLAPSFDWILIDSPPVVSITDALLLQPHADAVLLVVRAGQTPREAVEEAVRLVGHKQLAGIILNGVEHSRKHNYYYYGNGAATSIDRPSDL
jgi:capsular exopolysaccharide synthesis family protein